jgi:hypothetical protein
VERSGCGMLRFSSRHENTVVNFGYYGCLTVTIKNSRPPNCNVETAIITGNKRPLWGGGSCDRSTHDPGHPGYDPRTTDIYEDVTVLDQMYLLNATA